MDRHGKNLSEGTQAIDVLSYHYNGNQLIAVDDAITYDNGNDFIGNFVYVNDVLAWHNFDEGRVIYNSTGTYFAETYLKDHLGNIRVAFGGAADAVNSTIRQVNAYYPFGMNIRGLSSNNRSIVVQRNEYQYNGKMYQDEMGLNWYDYGARFYDAIVGRWWSVDPRAEKYDGLSPYNYCANNPINYIDPKGDTILIGNFIDRTLNKMGIKTEYVQKVELDIAQLKLSGDSEVEDMINELEDSPREHKILPIKSEKDGNFVSLNKDKANKGEKQGTTIYYNPEKKLQLEIIFVCHELGWLMN